MGLEIFFAERNNIFTYNFKTEYNACERFDSPGDPYFL